MPVGTSLENPVQNQETYHNGERNTSIVSNNDSQSKQMTCAVSNIHEICNGFAKISTNGWIGRPETKENVYVNGASTTNEKNNAVESNGHSESPDHLKEMEGTNSNCLQNGHAETNGVSDKERKIDWKKAVEFCTQYKLNRDEDDEVEEEREFDDISECSVRSDRSWSSSSEDDRANSRPSSPVVRDPDETPESWESELVDVIIPSDNPYFQDEQYLEYCQTSSSVKVTNDIDDDYFCPADIHAKAMVKPPKFCCFTSSVEGQFSDAEEDN